MSACSYVTALVSRRPKLAPSQGPPRKPLGHHRRSLLRVGVRVERQYPDLGPARLGEGADDIPTAGDRLAVKLFQERNHVAPHFIVDGPQAPTTPRLRRAASTTRREARSRYRRTARYNLAWSPSPLQRRRGHSAIPPTLRLPRPKTATAFKSRPRLV